jgi:RNA polymerase sigma-70 factor (ECF subfamily)
MKTTENRTPDFDTIYKTFYGKVLNHVTKRVKRTEIAEEITDDAFIKVYEKLHTYDPEIAKLNTWIYTIASNCIIDTHRKSARGIQTVGISDHTDDFGREIFVVADTKKSTDTMFEDRELKKKIKHIMFALDKSNRRVAILSFIRGKKYIEIAEILQMPMGTVKATIHRCRGILQKEFKNEYMVNVR